MFLKPFVDSSCQVGPPFIPRLQRNSRNKGALKKYVSSMHCWSLMPEMATRLARASIESCKIDRRADLAHLPLIAFVGLGMWSAVVCNSSAAQVQSNSEVLRVNLKEHIFEVPQTNVELHHANVGFTFKLLAPEFDQPAQRNFIQSAVRLDGYANVMVIDTCTNRGDRPTCTRPLKKLRIKMNFPQ